jgi:hypothetical protein
VPRIEIDSAVFARLRDALAPPQIDIVVRIAPVMTAFVAADAGAIDLPPATVCGRASDRPRGSCAELGKVSPEGKRKGADRRNGRGCREDRR